MKLRVLIIWCIVGLILISWCKGQEKMAKSDQAKKRRIDLVFAIDVSGSMQHIIAATQKKVWAIVNEMVKPKPTPDIRIGLIAYRGRNEVCYGARGVKVWDLTDDLDSIYDKLMALTTGGGDRECVGRAIYEAATAMSWDKSHKAMKILFVLGNEPANQDVGKYSYKKSVPEAVKRGININTVYCGKVAGMEQGWKEIASMADGVFTTIGIEGRVVQIQTPMDKRLVELNNKLNQTYIPYGRRGRQAMQLRKEMDKKAQTHGQGVLAERAYAKAEAFKSARWDLVDLIKDKELKIKDLEKDALPENLRSMESHELKLYVEKKAKERERIKEEIRKLSKQREKYIKEELKRRNLSTQDAFDQVILRMLRKQAVEKGFKFEEEDK